MVRQVEIIDSFSDFFPLLFFPLLIPVDRVQQNLLWGEILRATLSPGLEEHYLVV